MPELKTVQTDPKKALIICIPKTLGKKAIESKLEQLQKIQPEKRSIWIVLSESLQLENKTYVISKNNRS